MTWRSFLRALLGWLTLALIVAFFVANVAMAQPGYRWLCGTMQVAFLVLLYVLREIDP